MMRGAYLLIVRAFAMALSESSWETHRRKLVTKEGKVNQPIIIGYAHDVKSGKAKQSIQDGADVIIWSFLHLDIGQSDDNNGSNQQKGFIRTDLDLEEISALRNKQEYKHVVHLAAFGGWNGPHPPPELNGDDWCEVFMDFNRDHGYLFDGVDWDYEGNDDLSATTSKFTLDTLDIMADFSVHAKQKYGMIVSMAPAESYLDATAEDGSVDAAFSLLLDLPPRAWTSSKYATEEDRELIQSVGFSHAGRQCYTYVLAKAGIETFDWVSIQLYEAYSPFAHDISRRHLDPVDALMARVNRFVHGYTVDEIPALSTSEYEVRIPLDKLVIGVANRWADGLKFCEVKPESLRSAYQSTVANFNYHKGFLGVMFWTIEEEGTDEHSRYTLQLTKALESTKYTSLEQNDYIS